MSSFDQKLSKHTERKTNKQKNSKNKNKTQFEETRQPSEPDAEMAEMLKLSDQKFKATMINIQRALM